MTRNVQNGCPRGGRVTQRREGGGFTSSSCLTGGCREGGPGSPQKHAAKGQVAARNTLNGCDKYAYIYFFHDKRWHRELVASPPLEITHLDRALGNLTHHHHHRTTTAGLPPRPPEVPSTPHNGLHGQKILIFIFFWQGAGTTEVYMTGHQDL